MRPAPAARRAVAVAVALASWAGLVACQMPAVPADYFLGCDSTEECVSGATCQNGCCAPSGWAPVDAGTCVRKTCAQAGANCGCISDGCGGHLACGVCTKPQVCGGTGAANVCG